MIAKDLKTILKPLGCWPPKCHACMAKINPSDEVAFTRVVKQAWLAIVHEGCAGKPVESPTDEYKRKFERRDGSPSGGAWIPDGALL